MNLLAPATAETALIVYRNVRKGEAAKLPVPYLPVPAQLISVAVVYGGLSLVPDRYDRIAGLFAWGVVIATALNVFNVAVVGNKTNTTSTNLK